MVVDSTALPEQVVDAVVKAPSAPPVSCSALRLLCVHEAVADRVIEMLRGAMAGKRCVGRSALRYRRWPPDRRRGHAHIARHVECLRHGRKT